MELTFIYLAIGISKSKSIPARKELHGLLICITPNGVRNTVHLAAPDTQSSVQPAVFQSVRWDRRKRIILCPAIENNSQSLCELRQARIRFALHRPAEEKWKQDFGMDESRIQSFCQPLSNGTIRGKGNLNIRMFPQSCLDSRHLNRPNIQSMTLQRTIDRLTGDVIPERM